LKASTSLILHSHVLSLSSTSAFISSRLAKNQPVTYNNTPVTFSTIFTNVSTNSFTTVNTRVISLPTSNVSSKIPAFSMPPRITHKQHASRKNSNMRNQSKIDINVDHRNKLSTKLPIPPEYSNFSTLSPQVTASYIRSENLSSLQQLSGKLEQSQYSKHPQPPISLKSYMSCPTCQSYTQGSASYTTYSSARFISTNSYTSPNYKRVVKTTPLSKHIQQLKKQKQKTLSPAKKSLLDSYIKNQPVSSCTLSTNPLPNNAVQFESTASSDCSTTTNFMESLNNDNPMETTGTQTNQTLLLSIPNSINVDQFSNQTLNLDTSSINALKTIFQHVEPTSSSSTSHSPSHTIISSDNNIIESQGYRLPVTIANTSQAMNERSTVTNTPRAQSPSQLPIATVKIDFVDNKPQYSIQLNGQTVPVAAISVPTSEGMLELHSGNSNIKPAAVSNEPSYTPMTPSSPDISAPNTPIMVITPDIAAAVANFPSPAFTKAKFVCEVCGKSYARAWSYYAHIREHQDGRKEYSCQTCHKKFPNAPSLKQHLVIHAEDKEVYQCSICDKTFNHFTELRKHQLSHAEEKAYVCKAADCGKQFSSSSALRIHQRCHQEEKPYQCKYSECRKAFKTPSELSRHEFRHTGEKPFKCDQCAKSFVRNDDLKRHSFIHTGQKRFKCDQCDFTCIQSFDLVKHKYVHGGEKPFKCDQCDKQFTRPARLREHMRLHTGERPYLCEQCGKSFTQLTSLKSHRLTHGGIKPYQCGKCEKSFTNATDLQSHTNSHLGVKPFQCAECNKDFVSAKTLKRHGVVHSGSKSYECNICKKQFLRLSDLKVHMPVHYEDKPYKCEQCEKSFTRISTLKEHLRLHTGILPFQCHICHKEFNHRSHLNVHARIHSGQKPFKCSQCNKDFSRKASLKHHLQTHGIMDEDVQSNYSDDTDPNIQLTNIDMVKSTSHPAVGVKRKQLDDTPEPQQAKRLMTETQYNSYTQQLYTNTQAVERHHYHEVSIVDSEQQDQHVIQLPNTNLLPQFLHHEPTNGSLSLQLDNFAVQNNESHQTGGNLVQIHGLSDMQYSNSIIDQQSMQHDSPLNTISSQSVSIPGSMQLDHYQLSQQHGGEQHQVVGMTPQNMMIIPSIQNANNDNL